MTKEHLAALGYGTVLSHSKLKDSGGNPVLARVNGKMQVWKTRPEDFKLPMKHGLYNYFYITPTNAHLWSK